MTRFRYLDAWEIIDRLTAPALLRELAAQECRRKSRSIQPEYRDDITPMHTPILEHA